MGATSFRDVTGPGRDDSGGKTIRLRSTSLREMNVPVSETERHAAALIEHVPMPLALLDSNLCVRTANPPFLKFCGVPAALLRNWYFPEFARLNWELESLRAPLEEVTAGTRPELSREHVLEGVDHRAFRLNARLVQAGSDELVLLAIEDLTFINLVQARLIEDNADLRRRFELVTQALARTRQDFDNVAGRLLSTQEEERRRIGRELHDDLSQQVAILRLDAERIARHLPRAPRAFGLYLNNVRRQTHKLSRDLRRVAHQLHPSVLEHLGLAAALESLVREFGERENTAAHFTSSPVPAALTLDQGTVFYRITQEALRNIAKHAGQTSLRVSLSVSLSTALLTITDQGCGFDLQARNGAGLGLLSMKERARLIGGTLEIHSEPGEGTRIRLEVPLASGGGSGERT